MEDQGGIFLKIFSECDHNNTDNVQISVLLSYIAPYIDSKSHHFESLKTSLDSENKNPFIDKRTFLNAMTNWASKYRDDADFNFANNEEVRRQSTPKQSTWSCDNDSLNVSSISTYSLTGSAIGPVDPNILQDQYHELQHQNKKLSESLEDIKYQLTGLEEQNVCLQNEIERIHKNWQTDQKFMKSLQTQCAEYEKEREEYTQFVKENKMKQENLILSKKIMLGLENRIKELEIQCKAHIEEIENLSDLANAKVNENKSLHNEIEERDLEILRIQEREIEWRQKCARNELNIKSFMEETNDLKNYIQSMEIMSQSTAAMQSTSKIEDVEPDSPERPETNITTSSLSPEHIYSRNVQRSSPYENLHSELLQLSTLGCFNSCEYRIYQLEDEIKKIYDQHENKNQELKEMKSTQIATEEKLKVARKEIEEFNDKYNLLTRNFDQLTADLEIKQTEKQQLAIENKQKATENKQIKSKLSYYKTMNDNFKTQIKGKLIENTCLKKKIKEKESVTVQNLVGQIEKLKEGILCKESENKNLNAKLNSYHNLEEEAKDLKQINCKLMNEISSLERAAKIEGKRFKRNDLTSKINKLEETLDEMKLENQFLLTEKQHLLSKLELVGDNNYGKKNIQTLELKLQQYRKWESDLEYQIMCKNKEMQATKKEYDELDVIYKKKLEDYINIMTYIKNVKTVITFNTDILKSTTYSISNIWNELLNNFFPSWSISSSLNVYGYIQDIKHMDGPLQDEINVLNNQIHVTCVLLKHFAKLKNKMTISPEHALFNTVDIHKFYNPHESVKENNESLLSRLTPKRFFLKAPTLRLKQKSQNQFVLPPMSPECSPQSEMTAVQTHNATPNNLKDVEIKTNQLELNNNVSLSVMSDTNDPQSELLFTTLKIESSLQEAVVLETEAKKDTVLRVETSSIENGDNTAIQLKERLFSFNSTKTFNDSLIDKILMEQRVEDPLTKIDQTQAFDLECWDNSGSESVSSKGDDDEVIEKKDGKKKLEEERKLKEERGIIKDRQVRSLSEGAAVTHVLSKEGDVPVFPNLPDNALDALGLMASDIQKERLSDEEIEQKFKTLALAFSIDAVSIKERLERQQRQRDQAEDNLNAEIAKFSNAVRKLHPLCIDAETTELVTGLLDRLQLIVQASLRISTSAEIFGSVQQEWRIAESVNLMLSHLRNLVKQRDASRRQLQVTKRMLQETTSPVIKKPQTSATTRRLTINTLPTAVDGRAAPPRRASIAVIPRPQDSPSTGVPAIRRVAVRRISEGVSGERQEPLLRHWDCRKALEWSQDRLSSRSPLSSRPSRLEINPELTKIQEGSTESFTSNTEVDSSDENIDFQTPTLLLENPILTGSQRFMLQQHTTITNILKHYFKYYGQIAMNIFNHWAENGTLHEICFIGTIFCFAMATIFLCSTIMEIELARLGARRVPWKWVTWEEFFSFLYSIINSLSIIKTIH